MYLKIIIFSLTMTIIIIKKKDKTPQIPTKKTKYTSRICKNKNKNSKEIERSNKISSFLG